MVLFLFRVIYFLPICMGLHPWLISLAGCGCVVTRLRTALVGIDKWTSMEIPKSVCLSEQLSSPGTWWLKVPHIFFRKSSEFSTVMVVKDSFHPWWSHRGPPAVPRARLWPVPECGLLTGAKDLTFSLPAPALVALLSEGGRCVANWLCKVWGFIVQTEWREVSGWIHCVCFT